MMKPITRLATALLCLSLPGCIISTNDSHSGPLDGTLSVDWTINGSTDPAQCTQGVATDFDLIVLAPNGATVTEATQPCTVGVMTLGLAPGTYDADAVLLDAAGRERTTRIAIDTFVIHSGTDLSISVDFPANSFL